MEEVTFVNFENGIPEINEDAMFVESKNGIVSINTDVEETIMIVEQLAKKIKEFQEAVKEKIMAKMEEKGIIKFETDRLNISYVASTDGETFETKKFREENPDLYDEYVKISKVKPSVRIKLK